MVKNGDERISLSGSDEYGWNASPGALIRSERRTSGGTSRLEQQAKWTVQGIEYARKNWPWAGVISIWYFRQVGDIPADKAEYYFQMVDPAFVPQPVYNSVKADAMPIPGPASRARRPRPLIPLRRTHPARRKQPLQVKQRLRLPLR